MKPNRLTYVVLLNSYPKSQIHRLSVDNNTIITGRNAAGKTTLMGAIVPFYGVTLSSVARKSEVKKSFVDFYLPYDNSYIVYEYEKEGKALSVLLRNNNGTPVFHFITGAYHQDDFIEQRGSEFYFNSFEQIKHNIKSRHLDISVQIKQSDYEAIISNCPARSISHYGKDSRTIIQNHKQNFALVENGKGNFFGFADIIYNVLQSKLDFLEICKFLVQAMQKQGLLAYTTASLSTQINTELWVNQRKTWYNIEALRPQFERLAHLVTQNSEQQKQLSSLLSSAKAFNDRFLGYYNDLINQKQQKQNSLDKLNDELKALERQFFYDDNQLKDAIDNINNNIDDLEQQKLGFEKGDSQFEGVAVLYELQNKLPLWEREHQDKKQQYTALQEQLGDLKLQIDEIRRHFDKQINHQNLRFEQDKQTLSTQQQNNQLHYVYESAKLKEGYAKKQSQQQKIYQQQKDTLVAQKNDYEKSYAVAESELNNKSYSQKISAGLELLNQQKQQKQKAIKIQKERVLATKNTLTDIDKNIQNTLDEQKQKQTQINNAKDEIDHLRALSTGETLYGFLLSSEQKSPQLLGCTQRIFKTIDPALLGRQDLSPAWVSDDEQLHYFGLSLKTDALMMSEQPSLQEIYASIATQEQIIAQADDELKKVAQQQKTLVKKQKIAKETWQQADYQLSVLENAINELEQDEAALHQAAKEELNNRKQKLDSQLKSLAAKIADYDKTLDLLTKHHNEAIQTLTQDKERSVLSLQQSHNKQQKAFDEQQRQLKTAHLTAIEKLKVEQASAIKNKGYDPSLLHSVEREIAQLGKRIEQAYKAQPRLASYQHFLDKSYAKMPLLQEQKQTHQSNRQTLKHRHQKHQDDKQHAITQTKQYIDDLYSQVIGSQKLAERLDKTITYASDRLDATLLSTLGDDTTDSDTTADNGVFCGDWQRTAERYCQKLQDKTKTLLGINDEGKRLVDTIKKPFGYGDFGGVITSEMLCRTTDTNWHSQAHAFYAYISNEHENRKQLIIKHYTVQAEQVNNFKLILDDVHRVLNKFTAQINKSCRSICDDLTELAIDEFSMAIHSRITDNEWYPVLDEFSRDYQAWKNSHHTKQDLPDERLLASLEKVQTYVGQNNLTVDYVKQFHIDLIVKQHGQPRQVAKGTQSFKELSSNGTIRIAQLILYLSLFCMMGKPQDVELKLFIDEIGVLDEQNTKELLQILQKNQLCAMCAAPEVIHEAVIPLFGNNIACRRSKQNVYDFSQIDDPSELSIITKLEQYGCFQ